ncbi:hypothetical protein M231_02005 [Tremella mesenterica]|uniref:DNA ligase n=1 Tax=Tremella mesenterica TaxID=5217 RepID=A0A4Q1BRY4_TREME|nr:hypothetical protein M231_02005 [Tremella mesenterica]
MPPTVWRRDRRISPSTGQDGEEAESADSGVLPPGPSTLERPKDCINKNPTPAFSLLCTVMDRLRSEEMSKRKDTLTRFFNLWRIKVGNDLYPLIRLLLPERDRERPVYNLKEAMLAKCYIEVLGLDKHSAAAQKLVKWKQPVDGETDGISGDFARVCYHEIAARSTVEEGTLTLEAVNALLDQLAGGRMKQAEYVPILRSINRQCTPVEQEWIIRIILKDLRISIREKGVFSCFHPDAADLFNVCSDLKRVCWTLYMPDVRLEKNQTNIELFRSFLPQLCYRSPSSAHDAIARLVGAPNQEFVMEEKLDGERMQLHMRGNGAQWFYCSRKAKDYTYLYGAHIGEGSLTQHIAGAFHDDVRNIILDGEMLVWDPQLEKYLAFGVLKTFAQDKIIDDTAPRPCFKVFDILYLNDKCLTGKRLSERKRLLHSNRVFKDIDQYKGRLEFAAEERGKSGKDIRAMLEKILESRGEGLVVKKLESTYQTNSRGQDWVKVKPEYADQMGETLDVMVLGGWWGKGGRTGKLSSMLCGLRVQRDDEGDGGIPQFATFCRVGSGMSYSDYEWILNKHREHWKTFKRSNPPSWMKMGEIGLDDSPDVYIEPEHSFVMQVKASEIVPATGNFGIGYTLRFPRCKFIFYDTASRDHPVEDPEMERDMWNCLSVEEFTELLNKPKRKYEDDEQGSKRRKRKPVTRTKVQLISSVKGQVLSQEEVKSGIFDYLTFYVVKGDNRKTKAELEALIHEHGGDFTQAQLSDLSAIVIAPDDKSPLLRAQKKKGVSIVKPSWIYESIERKRPLPRIEELLVFASEDDQAEPLYHKTLDELDELATRDGSSGPDEHDASSGSRHSSQGARNGMMSAEKDGRPFQSSKQQAMENEWDLDQIAPSTTVTNDVPSRAEDSDEEVTDLRHPLRVMRVMKRSTSLCSPSEVVQQSVYISLLDIADEQGEGMGDAESNDYDEDKIFNHLVFYIDTIENAKKNGLTGSSPSSEVIERLDNARKLLIENGGKVVDDINEPKLTHIIMDDDDSSRYGELSRKTSK